MKSPVCLNRWTIVTKPIALAAALWLAGCATTPGTYRPARTQYKGDAVWDISAVDGEMSRAGSLRS